MTALADRPLSGLTLRPLPDPEGSSIATGPYPASTGSLESKRHLTIDVGGAERWQRPALVQYVEAELNALLELSDGWDGRRAHAVTIPAIQATVHVLAVVTNETSAPPQLFPLPDGGIQVEWHVGGNSIEIEIDAEGEPHVLAQTSDGETIVEGVIALEQADARLLEARNFLQTLSARLAHVLTPA